jgi:hypothetical protein
VPRTTPTTDDTSTQPETKAPRPRATPAHNGETPVPNPLTLPRPDLRDTATKAAETLTSSADTVADTVEQTIGTTTDAVNSATDRAREIVDPIVPDPANPLLTRALDPTLPTGQTQQQTPTGERPVQSTTSLPNPPLP